MLNRMYGFKISLFNLAMFLLSFIYGLKLLYAVRINSEFMKILNYAEWPLYLCMIAVIFFEHKYKRKELILIALMGMVLLFIYYWSGFAALFKGFLIIVAAKRKSYHGILSSIGIAFAMVLALSMLLYLVGVSDGGVYRRGYSSFGLIAANMWGTLVFVTCLCWLLCRKRTTRQVFLVPWAVALVIHFLVNNRSAEVLLILYPFIYLLINKIVKKNTTVLTVIVGVLPVVCLLFSVGIALLYPVNSLVQKLDAIASNRIFLNYHNISVYGIKFFSHGVTFASGKTFFNSVTGRYTNYNTVDNSYICLILQMGIIAAITYTAGYFLACKRAIGDKNVAVITGLVLISFMGVFESSILEIYINLPMLYTLAKIGTAESCNPIENRSSELCQKRKADMAI